MLTMILAVIYTVGWVIYSIYALEVKTAEPSIDLAIEGLLWPFKFLVFAGYMFLIAVVYSVDKTFKYVRKFHEKL